MRSRSRVWLSAFPFIFFCALISPGRLFAQQTTGAPASSNAIDQLTGPIALHPDPLVFQILAASTNVDTVKSFAAWMGKNATLKGSELQDAAQKAGFDAAYVALAPFPQVVQMMAQQPDWTKALGQAYTADEKAVFDSIQRLRAQALQTGNLKTTSQQKVETQTTSNGQQVIVVQPANPQVIYVPTYNPQTVYVAAPPPAPSGASVAGAAAVGFTAGVIIGSAIGGLATIGVILAAMYLLHMFEKVFLGPVVESQKNGFTDIRARELLVLIPILVVIFWIGIDSTEK